MAKFVIIHQLLLLFAVKAKFLSAATTFRVDDVEPAAPYPATDLQANVAHTLRVQPESHFTVSRTRTPVDVGFTTNLFVGAVHFAYDNHYPLVLSPDMIWQCVMQGFAIHVNQNAETLRHRFVPHEGRAQIVVRRNGFVKGDPNNDWEGVFGEFSDRIREYVGNDTHHLLTPQFSTTGAVERAAAQVVLMDAFKEYFEYVVLTRCGIPEITLEGTVEDWRSLRQKTLSLAQYNLQWWIDAIEPILNEFVSASSGNVNREFWRTIYKNIGPRSGGPYITGWILTLFPYLGFETLHRNQYLTSWGLTEEERGATTSSFPKASVRTPFKWDYYGTIFEMYFYAGFLGVTQDSASLAIRPVIGWAVVDAAVENSTETDTGQDGNRDVLTCHYTIPDISGDDDGGDDDGGDEDADGGNVDDGNGGTTMALNSGTSTSSPSEAPNYSIAKEVAIVVPIAVFLGLLTLTLLVVAISCYCWRRSQQGKTEEEKRPEFLGKMQEIVEDEDEGKNENIYT